MTALARSGHGWATRTAGIALMLWGLIHLAGGISLLVLDTADGLETLGPNVTATVPSDPGQAAEGLLRFHSLNITLGGLAVSGLVAAWWRTRDRWQLDVAVATATALDVGLIMFLVIPGVLPPSQGLIGPLLVAIASIGAVQARRAGPLNALAS